MTDKEQIIINGVNVSGCKCYNKNIKTDCLLYPLQPDACKDNPNCYFKQLARKTHECKEKDKELLSNEKIINKLMKEVDELKQECESLKEELNLLKNNEDLLISKLQLLWGKQIAEEQGDCKNIDYSKPRTKEIYHKITEIERTLKDVAFAQSVQMKKTQPLGETGSPRSYRNWERKERNLLERRLKDNDR